MKAGPSVHFYYYYYYYYSLYTNHLATAHCTPLTNKNNLNPKTNTLNALCLCGSPTRMACHASGNPPLAPWRTSRTQHHLTTTLWLSWRR